MSDNFVQFCFGIHNHQPVGNFGWVFDGAVEKSYLPFLDILAEFPDIKIAVHTSGPLIEWIESNRPEYIEKLGALVEKGQIEILGGGFYEPILSILPYNDALDQIQWMTDWAKSRLGTKIRGIWLTERIWEPGLPVLLSDAGIEFTICDTTHFQWAGLPADSIKGYFVTEKLGKTTSVFPIDRKLRYTIPFHDPEQTRDILLEFAETDPGRIVTYADDGEKFGLWPGTYDLVYERQWLRRFFTMLSENSDIIRFTQFGKAIDTNSPQGRVMLPTASYLEMTQWALPAKAGSDLEKLTLNIKDGPNWNQFEPFLRGGFWDNFLVKYPESNLIHKRMLRISEKVRQIPKAQDELRNRALRALFRGQCNCAYWHGLFGGLYLNYLRDALTRNLIEAESLADAAISGKGHFVLAIEDFDADGHPDAILESDDFTLVVSPALGGALSVVDLRTSRFAIGSVLSRKAEAYHDAVRNLPTGDKADDAAVSIHDIVAAKEEGLADHLVIDPWQRLCFQDHFLPPDIDIDRFSNVDRLPKNDFIQSAFDFVSHNPNDDKSWVVCERSGFVMIDGEPAELTLTKKFTLHKLTAEFSVDHTFTAGSRPINIRWGTESNLTLLTKDAPDRRVIVNNVEYGFEAPLAFDNTTGFALSDGWQKFLLNIESDRNSALWIFPVETVNQSEGGYERTYQGSSFTLLTDLVIEPGRKETITIRWKLTDGENE
jgi:alpha-amylase